MPQEAGSALSGRLQEILQAVVEEYIDTAEPVASRSTARRSKLRLSPASVRAAMAELTELGFLAQPHVSAGRVPTDPAYRLYVDSLLRSELEARPRRAGAALEDVEGDVSEFMQRAADLLSRATGQVGFYLGRPAEQTVLERIHFTRVSSQRVLALLVSRSRVVQTRLIEEGDCDTRALERISAQLSELVSGLTPAEARSRLAQAIEADRAQTHALQRKALVLGWEGLARASEVDWYVGDRHGLLEQPEFTDLERLRGLLAALEEKERMMRLLDKVLQAHTIVAIGAELDDPDVKQCSLVAVPLGVSPDSGGLGVIGPTRMPYDRVISAVRYVSDRVSQYLC